MILYLDTSAFVPLLVNEPTTPTCRDLWDQADSICSTRLLYVEAAAAVAQAARSGRLDEAELNDALLLGDDYWREVEVLDIDDLLMRQAAHAAGTFGLRGYDATHCATHCAAAARIADRDLVAVSGDQRLLASWHELGLATFDPAAARG